MAQEQRPLARELSVDSSKPLGHFNSNLSQSKSFGSSESSKSILGLASVFKGCWTKVGIAQDPTTPTSGVHSNEKMPQLTGADRDLWQAARDGSLKGVKDALDGGANVHCFQPAFASTVKYKSRKVTTQPLHVAAMYRRLGTTLDKIPPRGFREARDIVELLLEHRAEVDAEASSELQARGTVERRSLQAIHLAAGCGNADVVELLHEHSADVNADAMIQKGDDEREPHYKPVHDAAWFGHANTLIALGKSRADLLAPNFEGNTCLHLAARLGNVKIVEMLNHHTACGNASRSGCPERSASARICHKNKEGDSALDIAVKGGLFPPRKMHLFFSNVLGTEDRVSSFVRLAELCPEAAATLLKHPEDETELDDRDENRCIADLWRDCFKLGATNGSITPGVIAKLVHDAPEAAAYLLDALTDTPKVQDTGHNPLPIRARIDQGFGPCSCSCAYRFEGQWLWDKDKRSGRQPWHDRIAPRDPKHGKDVQVKLVNLKGICDVDLLHRLAETPDYAIFTKITTHAMLKLLWRTFKWLFVTDLIQEIAVTVVISTWVVSSQTEFSTFELMLRRGFWCFVASHGVLEVFVTCCWSLVSCARMLGWKRALSFSARSVISFRLVLGVLTVSCVMIADRDSGFANAKYSVILALTSLLHWMHLLFQLRGFERTGQKLLPILKSVQPIAGMVVIIGFLLVAFVHAFWAMFMEEQRLTTLFDVATLLFTGEAFLTAEILENMDVGRRVFIILLVLCAVFFFLACALNVFIAVLSDCYDLEQERMVCTFLKERAKICSGLFLRPSWKPMVNQLVAPVGGKDKFKPGKYRRMYGATALLVLGIFIALLYQSTQVSSAMATDIIICVASLFWGLVILTFQVFLRSTLTINWHEKYLWICSEVDQRELQIDMEDNHHQGGGRVARIKRFVDEQCRAVAQQCASVNKSMKMLRNSLAKDGDIDALDVVKRPTLGTRQRSKRRSITWSSSATFDDEEEDKSKSPKAKPDVVMQPIKAELRMDLKASGLPPEDDVVFAQAEPQSRAGRSGVEQRLDEISGLLMDLRRRLEASEALRESAESRCHSLQEQHKVEIQKLEERHRARCKQLEDEKGALLHLHERMLDRGMAAKDSELREVRARLEAEDRCHALEAQLQEAHARLVQAGVPEPAPPRPPGERSWGSLPAPAPFGEPPGVSVKLQRPVRAGELRGASRDALSNLFSKHCPRSAAGPRGKLGPAELRACISEVLGIAATPEIVEEALRNYSEGVDRKEFSKFFKKVFALVEQGGASIPLRMANSTTQSDSSRS